ncbi:MAG: Rid family hydrolase [Candidatus Poseidoniaceae archaeon]|nr:Rid family hydrolase [Candidatus Poseidoniaceae archaeon]
MTGEIVKSLIVPAHPHPVLCPEKNQGWQKVRDAFDNARKEIEETNADLLIIYSTLWPSVIGHQIQADPNPKWVMVDADFHDIGSIHYDLQIDSEFAHAWNEANAERGLESRTVAYHGFPIDVGSVVALELLNPGNRIPAVICSTNVYSNRAETTVLAKACLDTINKLGKKAVAVSVMSLSNRMFTEPIKPHEDRIHSLKDDEWNRKILEFLEEGRLEDVGQLSRTIHDQIRVKKVVAFKPMWWLSAMNGNRNDLTGSVLAYEPIHGAGAAVVVLDPESNGTGDKEYDEEDVEFYGGDRNVLDSSMEKKIDDHGVQLHEPTNKVGSVNTNNAPKPVGAYPHARIEDGMIYLSGVGPRQPGDNSIPGGPIKDSNGKSLEYDIKAQTRAVVNNIARILEEAGSSLDKVIDVTSFLVDMDRDFPGYNEVWAETLGKVGPTRTTLAISALPTPIAVEMKVIAKI